MENDPCIYYVSRTLGGGSNPSAFNVTKINEEYVATLIKNIEEMASRKRSDAPASVTFWDYSTDFAADEWRKAEGEEDPQCIFDKGVSLSDVVDRDAQRAFLRYIPPSLELALERADLDGGIRIRMDHGHRVITSGNISWEGYPKHMEVSIETCCLATKDLVQMRDWLATARQIEEQV